ncbi:MFS transporter [Kineosporia sp. NBRC 101731]|uniref:MFS transporter n=1 Tax=Kineosporia sp. NBRC 101731 TaxID=3032199 RepID=UPI0024A11DD5|nr:MFS transporter [Kineosporia sp. NBRC 101731]GLY29273.1 MFS transporter [Kineosporia sp. NBRC 101731]
MPIGLFALALGGFGIGLTEFGIVGLLPEVAADTGVSESVAGFLVSGYALSVAFGAVALSAAVIRMDRKKVLVGLMLLFILGNLISAVAPGYGILLAGRIVAALCHGAFFGIGAVVAADMVGQSRQGGAIALMFGGLTLSNVLGVPFGTLLGQQLGWRATFWVITALGVVTMIGIQALVPSAPAPQDTHLQRELAAFRRPQVWVSLAVSTLAFAAVIGPFTYVAFTLTDETGFATSALPWLLVLFGVGTFIGNYVGGRAADHNLDRTLMTALAVLTVVLGVFALLVDSKPAAVVLLLLMGTVGLSAAPGLQVRIMVYAPDAPTVASGANIAAFNIGNAIGAWIGGLTIAAGLGLASPLWVGAALAVGGVGALLVGAALPREATAAPAAPAEDAPSALARQSESAG